jgi:VanZ family protein
MRRHRSAAGPLAVVYLLLVAYASLYPFERWSWPAGADAGQLLVLPWPPWRDRFDEWANFAGYVPLGMVLFAFVARNGGSTARAWLAGLLVPALVSYGCEIAQHFIPGRFPTLRDWALNAAGAAAGTALAWAMMALGLFDRWQRVRERWFVPDSAGAIVLLLLWPVGLLFPAPVPLGMGQVFHELRTWTEMALSGTPWAADLASWLEPLPAPARPLTASRETLAIALGMLAPCLLAAVATRPGWRRFVLAPGAALLALFTMTLSTALNFGPAHATTWLTPVTLPAIAGAVALAVLFAPAGPRLAAALGLVVLTALVIVVAEAPADPYYAASLQGWEAGRFIRFHGLAQWIGWLWPYAAMGWLVRRLGRRD